MCGGENLPAAAVVVVATVKGGEAVKQFGLEHIALFVPSRPGQTDCCCGSCWCFGQTDARTVAWRQAASEQRGRTVLKSVGDCCCLAATVERCVPGVCDDTVWMNV